MGRRRKKNSRSSSPVPSQPPAYTSAYYASLSRNHLTPEDVKSHTSIFSDDAITDAGDRRTNPRNAVKMATLGLTVYLILGTIIFHLIERPKYLHKCRSMKKRLNRDILPLTHKSDSKPSVENMQEIFKFFQDAVDAGVHLKLFKDETNKTSIRLRCENKFSLQDSLLFCLATISTIGYGNSAPSTDTGQIMCVAYGVVGLPIVVFFIYYWSNFIQNIHDAMKPIIIKNGMWCVHFMKFILFLLGWFALPTWIFSKTENWSASEGVYFCFVTITTIGFGDYIPQRIKGDKNSVLEVDGGVLRVSIGTIIKWSYYIYIITWILSGMVVMSIFIERTAKRMHQTIRAVERQDCKPKINACDVSTDGSTEEWGARHLRPESMTAELDEPILTENSYHVVVNKGGKRIQ